MKSHTRHSKASGSDRRRVEDMVSGRGRYSPSKLAKREAAARRRHSRLEAGGYVIR